MKREEATEIPATTPSRLTTLALTLVAVIGPAYWTFVHSEALTPMLVGIGLDQGPMGRAHDQD
jgi:hypothetical protein